MVQEEPLSKVTINPSSVALLRSKGQYLEEDENGPKWFKGKLKSGIIFVCVVAVLASVAYFVSTKFELKAKTKVAKTSASSDAMTDMHSKTLETLETIQTLCDDACKRLKVEKKLRNYGSQSVSAKIVNSMNFSVDPCENFYEYSCGNWLTTHPKPKEFHYQSWDTFAYLNNQEAGILHDMLMKINRKDWDKSVLLKLVYQTCVSDGPDGLKQLLLNELKDNTTMESITMDMIKNIVPAKELSKFNFTEENYNILKKLNIYSLTEDELTLTVIRDACQDIVKTRSLRRTLERIYLTNIYLDNNKVNQVFQMATKIKSSLQNLLSNPKVPWTNDEDHDLYLFQKDVKKSIEKVKPCIGYFKELLSTDQFPVTLTDLMFVEALLDRINGTDLDDLVNLDFDDSDEIPTCYWTASPFDAKARYNKIGRSVEVSYVMMQAPMYDSYLPRAMQYGAIGTIIGHEMAHAIQVDKYLKKGKISPAIHCLVNQYSEFEETVTREIEIKNVTVSIGSKRLNGTRTLDENFSDNVGMLASYKAYKSLSSSSNSNYNPKVYSDDQLFFLSSAQVWCSLTAPEHIGYQMMEGHHSPNKFRVLGYLRNSKEFSKAFNCPKGSPMNPEEQCALF